MSSSISSAEWPKLYRYSDRALQIDRELAGEGSRIAGVLRNFEASCTEYRVAVSHLAGEIQGYASRAEGTDVWVRQVGVEFQRADRSAEILRISPYVELKRIQDWNDKLQWWYDQLLFPIGAMAIIRFSLLEGIKNPNIVRISLAWLRPVANFFGEDVWWLRGKVGIDHWTAATPGPLVWHFVSFLAVKDLLQTLPVVIEQATRDIFGPDGLPRKIGR